MANDAVVLDNVAMWSLIVGFFLPVAISVVVQTPWRDGLKSVVAFLICALAGAGTAYFAGDLTGRDWVTSSLVILVTALATYKGFWKPTGVSPAVETATSVAGRRDTGEAA